MKVSEFLQKLKFVKSEEDLEEIVRMLSHTEILEDEETEGEDVRSHEADRQRDFERDD